MPYLSHSQLEAWECQARWAHRYIARTPAAPAEALILGDAVHQALEADGRAVFGGLPPLSLATLGAIGESALEARLAADDTERVIPQAMVDDMRARLWAILEHYRAALQMGYAPVSQPEEQFSVAIPGAPDWMFTGKIDARVRWPMLTILDFKTGKAWAEGDQHRKPQADAYLWADRQSGRSEPAAKVVFAIFSTTRSGEAWQCRAQFLKTTRTPAQLAAYGDRLASVTRQIDAAKKSGAFPAKPTALCGWCNYWHACPTGRAYLERSGRPKPALHLPITKAASL